MIYSTATVAVNPPGEVPLTRAQVWQTLVIKARDARPFLPAGACTRCEVIAEGNGYIVREATMMGTTLSEIVTCEPESRVCFHQFDSPREGVIVNQILEDDSGELQLRYCCLTELKDKEPGGPEEQREQRMLENEQTGYKGALRMILARARVGQRRRHLASTRPVTIPSLMADGRPAQQQRPVELS